jgi:hypothetical protein
MTPDEMKDEVESGDRDEVIDRLRWYAEQVGQSYSANDVAEVIAVYESLNSSCPECERSFGPQYKGPCEH